MDLHYNEVTGKAIDEILKVSRVQAMKLVANGSIKRGSLKWYYFSLIVSLSVTCLRTLSIALQKPVLNIMGELFLEIEKNINLERGITLKERECSNQENENVK